MINEIANPIMPEIGTRYMGKVAGLTDFGAFVSIPGGKDGLLHVSKLGLGKKRIGHPSEVLEHRGSRSRCRSCGSTSVQGRSRSRRSTRRRTRPTSRRSVRARTVATVAIAATVAVAGGTAIVAVAGGTADRATATGGHVRTTRRRPPRRTRRRSAPAE